MAIRNATKRVADDLRADPNRRWAVAREIGAGKGTHGQGV
jgi:hypothetical protein